ncbi:hypothetical protein PRIPAC_98024 [Pristionchus pacificus]|uniref:Dehydrogenase n=1 Tax=Pristionchus pacificus TaxID=54126 RepID=A0A2A6D267_PRIPA|nr:hypothetical protein PRIPAC_98024 [Pristionchus pacificus]|eukprot:PDM84436.1 dehydrogenase [Pristionchus pacificus]
MDCVGKAILADSHTGDLRNYCSQHKDMGFFFGKVVIVAGSSPAIGRAVAILFAEQGAKIAIIDRSSEDLKETKRLCHVSGSTDEGVLELTGGITEESFLEKIVPLTLANFGKIDVLANIVDDTNIIGISEWDATHDLSIQSLARLTLLAIPHLELTRGSIVNLSSAANSPLDEITIQLAGSIIWKGVRVNSVNYHSERNNCKLEACDDKVYECHTSPMGQPNIPEITAKIILFIADRSRSAILVGQIISANGQLSSRSAIAPNF